MSRRRILATLAALVLVGGLVVGYAHWHVHRLETADVAWSRLHSAATKPLNLVTMLDPRTGKTTAHLLQKYLYTLSGWGPARAPW